MRQLTYEGLVEHIIDAEFTEIPEPSWMERAGQIAFYQYIQNINHTPKLTFNLYC